MTYLVIDNFAGGLDTRKSALTSPTGTLQRLNDAVITPGGEISKRKAFVAVADLTGTFGLAATSTSLYCFTRNTTVTAPSSGVPGVALTFQKLPNSDATLTQTDYDVYDGSIYLVTSDNTGVNKHYFNAVETQGTAKGYYVRTYQTKIYAVLGKNLNFSAVNDPTNWTTGTGAGFVNMAKQDADSDNLVSLEVYYNKLAIFSSQTTQIESVDPDPAQNVLDQVLRGAGAISPLATQQYGSGDVLYLSQTGVRSVRARDASNSAAVSDIGSPIDLDIQAIYSQRGISYFSKAAAILEPIVGRFWLIFPDQIYVLSYFPGPHITAWSRYTVPFTIDYATACNGHVFLRSGNTLYAYGGATGEVYDSTVAEIRLPYHAMEKPGHNKVFNALDMTVSGNWTVKNSFDYQNPDDEETLGAFSSPTWRTGRCGFEGQSPHFSLRFYTSGSGPAILSNAAVHYALAQDEN